MTTVRLTLEEIGELARRAFAANGCDQANTRALVRTIVAAERDGALSHGLFRVPGYVASLRSGKVDGAASPTVEAVTPAVLRADGAGGFAPLMLERAIPALADAARDLGVAVCGVRNTHHFAALWPEVEAMAARGLFGMACVSYLPVVAPAGGADPLFGTNPIAMAWPRPGRDPVVLDMATAAMAMGEVRIAARQGRAIPTGVGLDAAGASTTDPTLVKTLLPFGGHKGSGLALMVELLAGAAVGGPFSFEAKAADNGDGGPPRGGEFLLAMSPELVAGRGWAEHAEALFERFNAIDGARLPGARRHARRSDDDPRDVDAALVETVRGL